MRSSYVASFIVCASLAFVGCAAEVSHGDPSEETDENGNALSKIDEHLVGAFTGDWDFGHLVLKADGTYFGESKIECVTAPCIDPREDGTWRSSDFTSKTTGFVTFRPTGHASRKYAVALSKDGSSMSLTRSSVTTKLASSLNWCSDTVDCAGQRVHALGLMCMKGSSYHMECDVASNSCSTKCISDTPCHDCGVVCEEAGTMCPMIEFPEPTRTCLAKGTCGRDIDGKCGWLDQPRIDACIAGE
jgi:hypothetical protein